MTRFVMTLEQSVDLITYAILKGQTGTIIVPKLDAMRIYDLVTSFAKQYDKPFHITGVRPGEKIHESLINESQAARTVEKDGYMHIQSALTAQTGDIQVKDYSSKAHILTRAQLYYRLLNEGLL